MLASPGCLSLSVIRRFRGMVRDGAGGPPPSANSPGLARRAPGPGVFPGQPAGRRQRQVAVASRIALTEDGLTVTLAAGSAREQAAEINRRLAEAGISVYALRP